MTPIPKRPWALMVLAALLLALPAARWIQWALGHDAAGNPVSVPSATNLVLIVAGLYLSRIWFGMFLGHSFMSKFLASIDPAEPRRTITVASAWVARGRRVRLGLDLGNATDRFGWIPIGQTTTAFDPSAPFGLAGKVGVGRGAVLVSTASGQLVISARPMKAVRANRQLHPLGPTADRLLGWTEAVPLPALPTSGRIHVQDWAVEGDDPAVTTAAVATRDRLRKAARWIARVFGLAVVLLYLAPAGSAGMALALVAVIGFPMALVQTGRWVNQPLATAVKTTEGLDDRQARTLASMLLRGGLGTPA